MCHVRRRPRLPRVAHQARTYPRAPPPDQHPPTTTLPIGGERAADPCQAPRSAAHLHPTRPRPPNQPPLSTGGVPPTTHTRPSATTSAPSAPRESARRRRRRRRCAGRGGALLQTAGQRRRSTAVFVASGVVLTVAPAEGSAPVELAAGASRALAGNRLRACVAELCRPSAGEERRSRAKSKAERPAAALYCPFFGHRG